MTSVPVQVATPILIGYIVPSVDVSVVAPITNTGGNIGFDFTHANTWSGAQTFNDGNLILAGATSGTTTLKANATAGTTIITFPAVTDTAAVLGTTQDFTAPQMVSGRTANESSIYAGSSASVAQLFQLVANDIGGSAVADIIGMATSGVAGNNGASSLCSLALHSAGYIAYVNDNSALTDRHVFLNHNTLALRIGDTQSNIYLLQTSSVASHTTSTSTSPYTIADNDEVVIVTTGASAFTLNLPAANATTNNLAVGRRLTIIKADSGAGAVTITPAGTDTIEGAASASLATQYAKITLISDGTSVWYDLTHGGV